jgi:hypothetical protein
MLHHTSGHGEGGDVCRLMSYSESLEKPRCHTDAGCAAVDKSPYTLHLIISVSSVLRELCVANLVFQCRIDID